MPQCACLTQKGVRCGNMSKKGSKYCVRHLGRKCALSYKGSSGSANINAQLIQAIKLQQQPQQIVYVERKQKPAPRPRVVYIDSSNMPDAAPMAPPKRTCACRTRDGRRCQRRPNKGSRFCSTHLFCAQEYGAGSLMPPAQMPALMPPLERPQDIDLLRQFDPLIKPEPFDPFAGLYRA